RSRLLGRLKREMKEAVRHERYEEAARLRDAIFGLEDVFAHRRVLHAPEARYPWPIVLGRLQSLLKTERDIHRIEGYDISNISGTSATGSMVVFTNGIPDKSQYRKFRIRMTPPPGGGSDTDMHREVLRRRIGHPEWAYPDLIVIDGGKGQLNTALAVLRQFKIQNSKFKIPITTALAKREEILFTAKGQAIYLQRRDPALLHLFQRIRDESHRFARAYHHKLRGKSFKPAGKP
ncbi:MAG: UvrB/UvrC motif-containing protein, partial [bacterium]|nr:UvrB/UvrC motif-containing protein [bacterium]